MRQHSAVQRSPSKPGNESFLYKLIRTYIYQSSEPYHMGVSHKQKCKAEYFSESSSLNCLSPTGFHMIMLAVTRSNFIWLVSTVQQLIYSMSPIQHLYSHDCRCAASLHYVVKHRKHYHMKFFLWHKNSSWRFSKKWAWIFASNWLRYVRAWNVCFWILQAPQ